MPHSRSPHDLPTCQHQQSRRPRRRSEPAKRRKCRWCSRKFPSCIVGPDADVELRSTTGDYEAELVVVIGVGGRDIATDDARGHVAGLTGGQDISDRALQFAAKPPHFDMGKSRDTYGPIGPLLVSPDVLADRDDVPIRCDVNGERRQTGSTAKLIFDAPGDIIFTGTLTNTCR